MLILQFQTSYGRNSNSRSLRRKNHLAKIPLVPVKYCWQFGGPPKYSVPQAYWVTWRMKSLNREQHLLIYVALIVKISLVRIKKFLKLK